MGQVLTINPAPFVRGPKFSCAAGRAPILTPNETRRLLRAIRTGTPVGLRDRALVGLMVYTFACVSAAVSMNVKDVFPKQDASGSVFTRKAASATGCPSVGISGSGSALCILPGGESGAVAVAVAQTKLVGQTITRDADISGS
jgi:hypothetical protein